MGRGAYYPQWHQAKWCTLCDTVSICLSVCLSVNFAELQMYVATCLYLSYTTNIYFPIQTRLHLAMIWRKCYYSHQAKCCTLCSVCVCLSICIHVHTCLDLNTTSFIFNSDQAPSCDDWHGPGCYCPHQAKCCTLCLVLGRLSVSLFVHLLM